MNEIIIQTQAELSALPEKFTESTRILIKGGSPWDRIVVQRQWGSAHVEARDSAHVEARGSAHVEAWDSAHVVARDSAHVEAWGSAHVEAWDSAHVVARDSAAVHNYSDRTSLELWAFSVAWLIAKTKNVLQKSKTTHVITPARKAGTTGWLEAEGVKAEAGKVTLFKRVSKDWQTQEGTKNETLWAPGTTLVHPEWDPKDEECGPGKYHACSHAYFCDQFRDGRGDRYVAIEIARKDLFTWKEPRYPHKVAFRAGTVLFECDRYGKKVEQKPATVEAAS